MVRSFFSILSSTLFIAISIPTIILSGIYATYLNADFFDQEIVTTLNDQALEATTNELISRTPKVTEVVSAEKIATHFQENFPPELLQQTIASTIRQLKAPQGGLTINLEPYHLSFKNFIEDLGPEFIENIPKCSATNSKLKQPSTILKRLPSCLHSSMTLDQINSALTSEFERSILSDIPPSIEISPEKSPIIETLAIDSIGLVIKLGITVCLFFILIIVLTLYPRRRTIFFTIGAITSITGITTLIFGIIGQRSLTTTIIEQNPQYSNSLNKLVATLISFPAEKIIFISSIIIGISTIIFIAGLLSSQKSKEPKVTTPSPEPKIRRQKITPSKQAKKSPKQTTSPKLKKDSKPKKKPVKSKPTK